MSENQSNDNLSKLFQRAQQQVERSSQPPPMLWERLENKLEARPKRKPLSFLRFAAAASILMTLGMTGLLLMRSQKNLEQSLAATENKKQPDTIVTIVHGDMPRDKTTTPMADAALVEKKIPSVLQRVNQESNATQDDVATEMISAPAPTAPYMSDNIAQYGDVATSKAVMSRQEETLKDRLADNAKEKLAEDESLEGVSNNIPRPADQHVAGGPASNQAAAPSPSSYPPPRRQTSKKESGEPDIEFDKAPGLTVESEKKQLASRTGTSKPSPKKNSKGKSAYSKSMNTFSFLDSGMDEQGNISESWERVTEDKLRCTIHYKGALSDEKMELFHEKGATYLSLSISEGQKMERLKLVTQSNNRYIFEGSGLRITLVQGKTPTHIWEVQSLKSTLSQEQRNFFKARGFEPNPGFKEQLSRCVNRNW